MKELISFLNKLEGKKMFYYLSKIRNESILIEVTVPGQKWEIEFMENGDVEIEKFLSDGKIYGKNELEILFQKFSD
ncbi:MAG: hypothetical protein HND40_08200 [Ignavibacteriota bacterium]|nr:hypothetical protein [Ignavibacteriota bacterium]MBW7869347.1 hypothetical protein [Brumimicrobium sp.]MCO6448954.1 hypothetical protein [Ignavibacterium album]MCZ2269395.1 hypothetical protein [Ignavibacteriales bacterium]HMN16512.1 hypothetical protein [Ignavibacteriaceae bacterium]